MNFAYNHKMTLNPLSPSRYPFPIHQFRVFRRPRLKPIYVRNHLTPFDTLFHALITHLPSVEWLKFATPALGFASGVALYVSNVRHPDDSSVADVGEWILFTSPTPFNRFVFLRCPSMSFSGSEFWEDLNEKLVKEEKHFVRLNRGRILTNDVNCVFDEKFEYQRVCVTTEDGGVISMDWPANLDLKEEYGLDTTLLLVPGTPMGSMDESIRSFVSEALQRGLFPVVMNPRGCAGSPLTTARLFTAADSDDICTAIQFLNKARPFTTLMAVGWGYGANMLTKHLAEVGERTPITAATCIDNPFDLEEATATLFSPHRISMDQKITDGLIDILRSNKELFQGRTKSFDVEKALSAKSVRDFEEAISMVSYGFETIEDFYLESSTRCLIKDVKVPVLYIQSENGLAPLLSIPRDQIASNPFTSLLLCSYLPSGTVAPGQSALSWGKHLAIEWLTAVELGLLKGRHPLLSDVDLTINHLQGLPLMEGKPSLKNVQANKFLDLTSQNTSMGFSSDPGRKTVDVSDMAFGIPWRPMEDVSSGDMNDGELNLEDNERGQVLQTAQVVMNMLDITIPGTLSEEKKQQVLSAVNQGETLMKALQDAVPEDVRGKLTSAVSGIVHSQGQNLKLKEVLGNSQVSDMSSLLKTKTQEKVGVTITEGLSQVPHSADQMKEGNEGADYSDNLQPGLDKSSRELEPEPQSSEISEKPIDLQPSQSPSSSSDDIASYIMMGTDESMGKDRNDEFLMNEKNSVNLDSGEKESEPGTKPTFSVQMHDSDATAFDDKCKTQVDGISQVDKKEENKTQKNEEKDSLNDQNKVITSSKTEVASPPKSPTETQSLERESNDDQKNDNNNMLPVLEQAKSISEPNSPAFNVTQALDALTGMDDSTQVAVNSVFGVLENMISQLEGSGSENENVDRKSDSSFGDPQSNNSNSSDKQDGETGLGVQPDSLSDQTENKTNDQTENKTESDQNSISFDGSNVVTSHVQQFTDKMAMKNEGELDGPKILANKEEDQSIPDNVSLNLTLNHYVGSFYNDYFWKYLLMKLPSESLDINTTTALLLDYIPEEDQWKLLEQPGNGKSADFFSPSEVVERKMHHNSLAREDDLTETIEPSYVILDGENQPKSVDYVTNTNERENFEADDRSLELDHFVRKIILDTLKIEVGRRLSANNMRELEPNLTRDLEHVANTLSIAVGYHVEHNKHLKGKYDSIESTSEKFGTLHGEHVIRAISSAVQDTSYLRKVLPFGVIVGSTLAALRKNFTVTTATNERGRVSTPENPEKNGGKGHGKFIIDSNQTTSKSDQNASLDVPVRGREKPESKYLNKGTVMVGAVTAALGASALLVEHQNAYEVNETAEDPSMFLKVGDIHQEPDRPVDTAQKSQNNIVTSFAEKAMSIASPVVPTTENGAVDQERLVAMLTDLGQKGGMLKLVGKVALLWGGLRGAMSLTDRLISFLRIAERPLLQRILGFAGMVLVIWSPVAIPLLPTLVQNWTAHTHSRVSELTCILGLYAAVMILVMLWGRRIRGYENPLQQYGLDVASFPKINNFLKGLFGGIALVFGIQLLNTRLGYTCLSCPSSPSSLGFVSWFRTYGKLLILCCQGILMGTVVTTAEELLFRSWLPEEIASDLGYYQGIIISGLAFALFQRCPQAIPGLWVFSLGLAGVRQRTGGSLSIPIGLRTGMMATSFVLQRGGFLTCKPQPWIAGGDPFQPLSGVVGFTFSALAACILYPKQPEERKHLRRTIRE